MTLYNTDNETLLSQIGTQVRVPMARAVIVRVAVSAFRHSLPCVV